MMATEATSNYFSNSCNDDNRNKMANRDCDSDSNDYDDYNSNDSYDNSGNNNDDYDNDDDDDS